MERSNPVLARAVEDANYGCGWRTSKSLADKPIHQEPQITLPHTMRDGPAVPRIPVGWAETGESRSARLKEKTDVRNRSYACSRCEPHRILTAAAPPRTIKGAWFPCASPQRPVRRAFSTSAARL
jgi:hypothetical protein